MARNGKRKTKKPKSVPFIEPDAAGIDIGATEIYVAVPEERDNRPVRKLRMVGTGYSLCNQESRDRIHRGLLDRPFPDPGVPGFGSLYGQRPPCQRGAGARNRDPRLPVAAIPPGRYARFGGKDCSILRHRDTLLQSASSQVLLMQKALTQMNLQLHNVISDITGVSGLAIIDAILLGEREPSKLAGLCDARIKASRQVVAKSLVGDYRPEHLFCLQQALES